MKKIVLSIAILVSLTSLAKASEPIRWGIVGGMNISKPAQTSYDEQVGFHIGGKAEYQFSGNESGFYVNPAILFSLKGGEPAAFYSPGEPADKKVDTKERNYYLDIPVYVGYKHTCSRKITLSGSLGPYMGIGLFGKAKRKLDGHVTHSNNIYGSNGYLKRFDFGVGGQIGIEFVKRIQFSLSYELGLKNVAKHGDYKNRNFMVSCGYLF